MATDIEKRIEQMFAFVPIQVSRDFMSRKPENLGGGMFRLSFDLEPHADNEWIAEFYRVWNKRPTGRIADVQSFGTVVVECPLSEIENIFRELHGAVHVTNQFCQQADLRRQKELSEEEEKNRSIEQQLAAAQARLNNLKL